MLVLYQLFILSASIIAINDDQPFEKQYKSIGRVGYFFKYLDDFERTSKPELKSENIIPPDRIPKYNHNPHLTSDEQNLVQLESTYIITSTTQKASGSYEIFDKNGNLYSQGKLVKYPNGTARKLYKHIGSIGNHLGDVSDEEHAVTKQLTYRPRHNVYSITGLYAPPGEVISIKISKADLRLIGSLIISIGPILNNGDANNIWNGRDFVRMPILCNNFILRENLEPAEFDGTYYTFYIGSYLGGPIYLKNKDSTVYSFTVTISGAVRYPHYVLGYTTPDEYSENMKSSAPYFDLEVWQNGMLHSGPRQMVKDIAYEECYDAAIYWQKVTSVSSQIPSSFPASISVNMMYEPFIAAGAAVAFGGRATTNCPLSWFTFVTSYKDCLQDSSCDTWGPHHEYHHHFQNHWGMNKCGETSNNLVTLISYSLFSKVSQRRTEEREPDGDNWNHYTSGSWCLNDAINTVHTDYHLVVYGVFLHSFGQDMMIKVVNTQNDRTNKNWFVKWTEATELNLAYFFSNVYKCSTGEMSIPQDAIDLFKDKNYKYFVPIACRYQTGIGIKIKEVVNKMHTMLPFLIRKGEDKVLNFTKQMIVPPGFTYTIVSVTDPQHGTLTNQEENIYVYKPDPNNLRSGEMTFTIHLSKNGDSNFAVDDIEMYVELQQTGTLVDKDNHGRDILDRTIYTYPEGQIPDDPIAEYESNFANATSSVTILNNATQGGLNTQIMLNNAQNPNKNTVSVLEGKFYVEKGKYRIALMCRNYGVLYLSYDGGNTYVLGPQVLFECADERYYTEREEPFVTKEFNEPQWVYFKFVVCHKMNNIGRRLFSKIGLDKYSSDGTVSSSVTDLTNARSIRYEPDPVFYAKDVYPNVWSQSRKYQYFEKGELLSYNYEKYPDPKFEIGNLFDDDDTNIIHTNGGFVTDTSPFMVLVDLGKEITANSMTIYGATQGQWQYQPTTFKLYAGKTQDNLELVYEVENSEVVNHNVYANFAEKTFRYYQLNVTNGKAGGTNRFVVFRYVQFSNEYKGTLVSIDDDRVTLYNEGWKKSVSPIATFGNIYVSKSNGKVVFKFTGTGFGINSEKSNDYGSFTVNVDGSGAEDVNLKGSPTDSAPCVFIKRNLVNKEHTVTLTAKDSSSFNIDSFIILQDDLAQTSEELPESRPPTPTPTPVPEPVTKPETPSEEEEEETPVKKPTEIPFVSSLIVNTLGYIDDLEEYTTTVTSNRTLIIGDGMENLYLSIKNENKNVNVLNTNAKFGFKLDSGEAQSITLNQENPSMNVKGSGTLTINANGGIQNIALKNAIVKNTEKLNINVQQELESLEFDSLSMSGQSSFKTSSKNPTRINSFALEEGSNVQIENIEILNNDLHIGLNTYMTLTNVDLSLIKSVKVTFDSSAAEAKAAINGKPGKPPVSISLITKNNNNNAKAKLLELAVLPIVSASTSDFANCNDWVQSVHTDGTKFDKVECIAANDATSLIAYDSSQYKPPNSDGSGGSNKKNKTPIIIGVVVAVVVVIVVVVVVVVVVIKKKRRARTSEIKDEVVETVDNDNDIQNEI